MFLRVSVVEQIKMNAGIGAFPFEFRDPKNDEKGLCGMRAGVFR